MIETIHIFDEFSQSPDNISTEDRHKKRMSLDPLIYDILKKKYEEKLERFWESHSLPKESDSYIVLVERRIHPNLAFLLYNAAYFARNWGIVIICSDINYEYCKKICGKHFDNIHLIPLFQGNPPPAQGKQEYNDLLKNPSFYASLPGENLLFLEMDCYIRKTIPEEWKQYDFIAAPYEWDETAVGGGFSFRKKNAMIRVCSEYSEDVWAQDTFLFNGVKKFGYSIPPFEIGLTYIAESCLYEDPIGVHQWWTFFFPKDLPDADEIFHSLLSMEVE